MYPINRTLPSSTISIFSFFSLSLFPLVFICLFLVSLNTPSVVLAQSSSPLSAEETLLKMMSELKESKNPSVMLNYVYWPQAFANFPAEHRARLQISSAEELKSHFKAIIEDPGTFMREQLVNHAHDLPEEHRAAAVKSMKSMVDEMESHHEVMRKNMRLADYQARTLRMDEGSALIELRTTLGDRTDIDQVELVKIANDWYLPTVVFIQTQARSSGRTDVVN